MYLLVRVFRWVIEIKNACESLSHVIENWVNI